MIQARLAIMNAHMQECIIDSLKNKLETEPDRKYDPRSVVKIMTYIQNQYDRVYKILKQSKYDKENSNMLLFSYINKLYWQASIHINIARFEYEKALTNLVDEEIKQSVRRYELAKALCDKIKSHFDSFKIHEDILRKVESISREIEKQYTNISMHVRDVLYKDWSKAIPKKYEALPIFIGKPHKSIRKVMDTYIDDDECRDIINIFSLTHKKNTSDGITIPIKKSNPERTTTTVTTKNRKLNHKKEEGEEEKVSIFDSLINKMIDNITNPSIQERIDAKSLKRIIDTIYLTGLLEERKKWLTYIKNEGVFSKTLKNTEHQNNDTFILSLHPIITKRLPTDFSDIEMALTVNQSYLQSVLNKF
jgi:hypothetical protein